MLTLILAILVPCQAATLDRASFCLLPAKPEATKFIPKHEGKPEPAPAQDNSKKTRYGYTRRPINC